MEAITRRHGLRTAGRRGATPTRRSPAPVAAALAVALAVLAAMSAFATQAIVGPAGVRAMGPLPACRYDDILTSPRGYGDWSITLVDTILRVPKGYAPPDLVGVGTAGIAGGGKIRAVAIDDLRAMAEAAAAAGATIGVQSAYRSYASQEQVFAHWVNVHGYARALQLSARPGHSEHQLGVAIDFRSEPGGSPFNGDWATTAAGKWMKAHAWEYGWLMSYPRNKLKIACYDYEPWHYRYVGRELAAEIHASGLTPREYLWANFTTTVVPAVTPKPPATARPTRPPTAAPTPTPSPTPEPTATVSPSPTPEPTATPSPSPTPAPSLAPTPAATAAPGVPSPIGLEAGVVVGLAGLTAGGLLVLGWMVLRRGRSGVGL